MADSEWLQTLKCLDPHEPKNAEALRHIGVDEWRDRICSDPLWGSGKSQLQPRDLLTAYLLCLFGAVTFEQVCEHIERVPDFWKQEYAAWPSEWEPLWLPGYSTFLTHLPNGNLALSPLTKRIETRASESAHSKDLAKLLLLHPESEVLSAFSKETANRQFEKERRQAMCHSRDETRSDAIRSVLEDWSYYPLLVSILPRSLAEKQLREILGLLDLPTFLREAGLVDKFKTVEDMHLWDKSLAWPRSWISTTEWLLSSVEYAARWCIGCKFINSELPWQRIFSKALAAGTTEVDMSGYDPSIMRIPLEFISSSLLARTAGSFVEHQRICLKAAAKRFSFSETPNLPHSHSLDDHNIIAAWDGSRSSWIVTWKDVFDAQKINEKTKDLAKLFDALATSQSDPNKPMDSSGQPQWKINTTKLVLKYWPKARELSDLHYEQMVDDEPRPLAQDRSKKREHRLNVNSEIGKSKFGALLGALNRGKKILRKHLSSQSQRKKLGEVFRKEGQTLWTTIDPTEVSVNMPKDFGISRK